MQRISVDLPDPEGPQITTRSPLRTLRLISASTWKSPNHLWSPLISTAKPSRSTCFSPAPSSDMAPLRLAPLGTRQPIFDAVGIARHEKTEHEIEHGGKRVAGRARHRRRPFGIDAGDFDGFQQIKNPDEEHQGRVLEECDEAVDDVRDGDAQGLRQDNQP